VFIDFQKAFDMLWKHGLLQKMVSLNIYGNMLSYVNGFLSNKFRLLEKIIPTVLFGDNKNPHVEHYLLILSRSCCILFCRCFHIQYIHTKCIKILNCMRLLTGTKWGANSYTLRNIYFALIRSKIDYGCEVYNSELLGQLYNMVFV
jgi:hypothetical protein